MKSWLCWVDFRWCLLSLTIPPNVPTPHNISPMWHVYLQFSPAANTQCRPYSAAQCPVTVPYQYRPVQYCAVQYFAANTPPPLLQLLHWPSLPLAPAPDNLLAANQSKLLQTDAIPVPDNTNWRTLPRVFIKHFVWQRGHQVWQRSLLYNLAGPVLWIISQVACLYSTVVLSWPVCGVGLFHSGGVRLFHQPQRLKWVMWLPF